MGYIDWDQLFIIDYLHASFQLCFALTIPSSEVPVPVLRSRVVLGLPSSRFM